SAAERTRSAAAAAPNEIKLSNTRIAAVVGCGAGSGESPVRLREDRRIRRHDGPVLPEGRPVGFDRAEDDVHPVDAGLPPHYLGPPEVATQPLDPFLIQFFTLSRP